MDKTIEEKILQAAKSELMKHSVDTFVDGGVSVALARGFTPSISSCTT
jgi:hypothetical protein